MNTGDAQAIRFLFVLSTERSGSTLLSFMLGAHSRVISPPELHLLAYPTFNDWRRQYPAAIKSLDFLLASCGQGMDKTRIEAQFGGQTTEFVYRWLASQENLHSRIIVDKTPKYARDLAVLQQTAKLEPLYIWLIRHPLGVAASKIALRLERRKQHGSGLLSCMKYRLHRARTALRKRQDVCAEVAYWSRVNTQIEQFLATIDSRRKQQVHFEQLVKEPRSVMDRLCHWLDIPFEPATLDPQAHLPTVLEPKLGDPKVKRHTGIHPTAADYWRRHYSEQLLDTPTWRLGVPTRELMDRWGIIGLLAGLQCPLPDVRHLSTLNQLLT